MIKKHFLVLLGVFLLPTAFAQGTNPQTQLASMAAQLERIEAEVRLLSGGSEGQSVQMKQLQQSMESRYRDLEMRIVAIEGQIKLFQQELKQAIAIVNPKLEQERKELEKGLGLMGQTKYKEAIQAFEQFLKKYPKSLSKGEALFWIAESREAMGESSLAIKDYQKFVTLYPKSDKAPLAILKQGEAFLKLNMKKEAKVFWEKLIKEYPQSTEASQAKSKIASLEETGTAPITSFPRLPEEEKSPTATNREGADF